MMIHDEGFVAVVDKKAHPYYQSRYIDGNVDVVE
jgi:hypothetical protein